MTGRELEICDVVVAFHICLPIIKVLHQASLLERFVELRAGGIVRPSLPSDLVSQVTFFLRPAGFALFHEIGLVEDVAFDGLAQWVRGRRFGEVGQIGRVGVVDDLVVGTDPAVVPLDDVGG